MTEPAWRNAWTFLLPKLGELLEVHEIARTRQTQRGFRDMPMSEAAFKASVINRRGRWWDPDARSLDEVDRRTLTSWNLSNPLAQEPLRNRQHVSGCTPAATMVLQRHEDAACSRTPFLAVDLAAVFHPDEQDIVMRRVLLGPRDYHMTLLQLAQLLCKLLEGTSAEFQPDELAAVEFYDTSLLDEEVIRAAPRSLDRSRDSIMPAQARFAACLETYQVTSVSQRGTLHWDAVLVEFYIHRPRKSHLPDPDVQSPAVSRP
eukprot:TRINITY_DN36353_c0_g2_i2.p1 TRINITY_DN36353_c0_g2~~TRINITY_DN36353_c0_g2_i2.p1  ORF type:complete len:260 (-),score=34.95 TRINITY_DN36353_c0_g2_i2:233-1012(-)